MNNYELLLHSGFDDDQIERLARFKARVNQVDPEVTLEVSRLKFYQMEAAAGHITEDLKEGESEHIDPARIRPPHQEQGPKTKEEKRLEFEVFRSRRGALHGDQEGVVFFRIEADGIDFIDTTSMPEPPSRQNPNNQA